MVFARVEHLSRVFEAKREGRNGVPEGKKGIEGLPASLPLTRDSFDGLVSTLYKWFIEAVKADTEFLLQSTVVEEQGLFRKYLKNLKALRHARQHDDAEQEQQAERWCKDACYSSSPTSAEQFEACSSALIQQTEDAIGVLIAMANSANRDVLVRTQWDSMLNVRVLGVDESLDRALQLIGRRPRPQDRAYLLRELENHWPRYLAGAGRSRPQNEALEASASFVVSKWLLKPLACPPDQLLAAANGTPADAQSILLLAHTLQEGGMPAAHLTQQTAAAWQVLRDAGHV